MKILLMAPHPFYVERGSPIAVKLLAQALCSSGHEVDLLTYHEGDDVQMEGLRIYRTARLPFTDDIPIGLSPKKLVCDVLMFYEAMKLIRRRRYDVIHAVEESIFIACALRPFQNNVKIVYDMDSSMADQLIEKWRALRSLDWLFNGCEGFAIRRADLVLPVCQALADKVESHAAGKPVCVLQDIALNSDGSTADVEDIRAGFAPDDVVALYVGNLEHYQGIDLTLEALVGVEDVRGLQMVFIGGAAEDISAYAEKASRLGVDARAHFLGPKPVSHLMKYLEQADILLSPRIKGSNTPMKIYSYLASGKPILATEIDSHTQVLDPAWAMLAKPDVAAWADRLAALVADPELRLRLGRAGAEKARRDHTYDAFKRKLAEAYESLANA